MGSGSYLPVLYLHDQCRTNTEAGKNIQTGIVWQKILPEFIIRKLNDAHEGVAFYRRFVKQIFSLLNQCLYFKYLFLII